MKIELKSLFLEYYIAARSLVKISTFFQGPSRIPQILHVVNLSGLMKNKGKDTTVTLNGCCDASQVNVLVNIKKKFNFFYP